MSALSPLLKLAPQEFVEFLRKEQIRRFHFVYDPGAGKMIPSHEALREIAEFIGADTRDFAEHEGLFFQVSKKYDTLQGAFVHRTNRGQAAGGVRYWNYESMEDYLRDGLRLAKGMTHKNALAGLWWGGGKGVMAWNPAVDKHDPVTRESIYKEYGELMTALRGCYVTAEDVGANVTDMANIFSTTRFTTCIPPELGGSGNPSVPTARGVVRGMEAALHFKDGGTLKGKTVAVQGMGNVGGPLIKMLFDKGADKVIACDFEESIINKVKEENAGSRLETRKASTGDEYIFSVECDILAPCATGAVLNPTTIPQLKASIICGAANNQLEEPVRDDRALHERGILYVPDFLTNRMGIVNCADEQAGYVNHDPNIEKHLSDDWEHSVFCTAVQVFDESKKSGLPPGEVALRLADELSRVNNPLFGHRSVKIIASLVEDKWYEQ